MPLMKVVEPHQGRGGYSDFPVEIHIRYVCGKKIRVLRRLPPFFGGFTILNFLENVEIVDI